MAGPVVTQLDGGIVRVTLALPWALDHVHCYALPGRSGWTLVDSGLGDSGTLSAWSEVLPGLGPVERLVITHYHPDHLGAGAGLVRMTGAGEVVQGELDARLSAHAWGSADSPEEFRRHLELHGMPAELAARSTDAEQRLPIHPPAPTRLVNAGDELEAAGERWVVHLLPGHADGHIALHGQRSGRLLGGDVLLAEITPNIGRWPDTAPDPLGAYLSSLDAIDALAPSLVLPGHGPPIDDPARRTRELREHHRERLDVHLAALAAGADTAYAVAQTVWADVGLGFHEQRFALVESLAHLERLQAQGRADQPTPGRWAARGALANAPLSP
jgi:glyoxylase-like metal-dependent hydrolase (beta-lactamase superfamily II)